MEDFIQSNQRLKFRFLETIVTPLAMHNWGWAQATAIQNIGE